MISFKKKEKLIEKKKLQSEKRRRRAHAVKNDRLRFFHGGFTQVGCTTEKYLSLFVLDVPNFLKALETELIWISK